MTVEEVIEMLKQVNPKLEVYCYDQYGGIVKVNDTSILHWDDDKTLIFYNENKNK